MNVPDFDACISFESPVGNVNLYSNNDKVVFLTMGDQAVSDWGKSKVLAQAKKQLVDYFQGKNKVLDFPVSYKGTAFQESVWGEISRLPWGETTTYAEIAEAIGNPKAVRAVGGAVGSNPVPLVVGCHRVLGASKKITGYSGGDGIPTKKWLLAHEAIEYRD